MGQGGPRGRHQGGVRPKRSDRDPMVSDTRTRSRCSIRDHEGASDVRAESALPHERTSRDEAHESPSCRQATLRLSLRRKKPPTEARAEPGEGDAGLPTGRNNRSADALINMGSQIAWRIDTGQCRELRRPHCCFESRKASQWKSNEAVHGPPEKDRRSISRAWSASTRCSTHPNRPAFAARASLSSREHAPPGIRTLSARR
jgi:hypothetical protein